MEIEWIIVFVLIAIGAIVLWLTGGRPPYKFEKKRGDHDKAE